MTVKSLYLGLAILGAILPWLFFVQFIASNGIDPAAFLGGLFANGAAAGFRVDLLISSLVFWITLFTRAQPAPSPWPFLILNLTIGLSCALPAYLWASFRDRGA